MRNRTAMTLLSTMESFCRFLFYLNSFRFITIFPLSLFFPPSTQTTSIYDFNYWFSSLKPQIPLQTSEIMFCLQGKLGQQIQSVQKRSFYIPAKKHMKLDIIKRQKTISPAIFKVSCAFTNTQTRPQHSMPTQQLDAKTRNNRQNRTKIPLKKNTVKKPHIELQSIININTRMENTKFTDIINRVKLKGNFEGSLPETSNQYLLDIFKVAHLKTDDIVLMFSKIEQKFYSHRSSSHEEFWHENELRIFIWLLFAYLHVLQNRITDLSEEDWQYFSVIFNGKPPIFFEYQARLLTKEKQANSPWSLEETELLQNIIEQKQNKNQWNSIARDLYIRSNKIYLRNPKQCRERWNNHIDPAKLHSKWTESEDLALLLCIHQHGRKWSKAAKILKETRTEHMVKNRYKSLTAALNKRHRGRKTPEQVETILINKLTKSLQKKKKQAEIIRPEQELLFFTNDTMKQAECYQEIKQQILSEDNQSQNPAQINNEDYCLDMNCSDSGSNQLNSNPYMIHFKIDEGMMPSKFYEMDDERIFLHENCLWKKEQIEQENIFKI